jgi:hypothetical protein
MLAAVLGAAAGSLTAADIAKVIATRLDHHRTPLSIELDVLEVAADHDRGTDPAVAASSAIRAAQIFAALTDTERILLPRYDLPVRELEEVLPLRKSQASLLRQRLATRLRVELDDDESPDDTIAELCSLCEQWAAQAGDEAGGPDAGRTAALGTTLRQDDSKSGSSDTGSTDSASADLGSADPGSTGPGERKGGR